MFAPTTAAICIMLIACPSFSFVMSVTLPDLLLDFVFKQITLRYKKQTLLKREFITTVST